MNIVLDTNVLVSALIVKKGKSAQILKNVSKFHLFSSEEILNECKRVLHYTHIQKKYRLSETIIRTYLRRLRDVSVLISNRQAFDVVKEDPDDNKFIAVASAVGATYIVSGDPHLTKLKTHKEIRIITPAEFLKIITKVK